MLSMLMPAMVLLTIVDSQAILPTILEALFIQKMEVLLFPIAVF